MGDILRSMQNEQLVAYIRDELGRGISRDEIIRALIKVGWSIQDINATFASFTTSVPNISDDTPTKSANVPPVSHQTNIAIGANTYHHPIQIFVKILNSEISMAFLLALALSVIVFINLTTLDETRNLLQRDSLILQLIYYPAVPITLPIEYLLYAIVRFPIPIDVLFYPPAVLMIWTAILYIPIILVRRFLPNTPRVVKYTPSFLIVVIFATTFLFSMLDTKSRDEAFLETCLGPEATSAGCFGDFIGNRIRTDLYPLSEALYSSQGNVLIDKHIEYCFSLPEKSVDERLIRYKFSNLSYKKLCIFAVIDSLLHEETLFLSLPDFMNQFPDWQTKAIKRKLDGSLFISVNHTEDFQSDVRKYLCGKVYGPGSFRENAEDYSVCIQPQGILFVGHGII